MTIGLRFISAETDNFVCDIEINKKSTFLDLHKELCRVLNFNETEMSSFFVADSEWQKNEEILLMDMGMEENINTFFMSNTCIGDFINEEKERLLYLFDVFNDRYLFVECYSEMDKEISKPVCVKIQGELPEQIKTIDDNFLYTDSFDDENNDDNYDEIIDDETDYNNFY